jgi:hypothetical protein
VGRAFVLALLTVLAGCEKNAAAPAGPAQASSSSAAAAAPATPARDCGHAACGESYFIDAAPEPACTSGGKCRVALKLVATGDFHVNDQYPYRFKADEARAVQFLGTDAAGKNVFSKSAGDWAQTDAKSGVMTVQLTPAEKGDVAIGGVFKLSVCSAQNCLIEQPQMRITLAAR